MGKKTDNYKNLKINFDEIVEIINAWGTQSEYNKVSVTVPKDLSAQTMNYLVDCDGKIATLSIFKASGGVYSISPKFGKEKEISTLIADYISCHCGTLADSNPYKNGLSIDISKGEFEAFYQLMKEQQDVIVDEERTEEGIKFFSRLRNTRYGDTITVSYYNTGKMVIQGKVLELFCLAVEIISEGHDLQKIVNAETKSAGLTVNGADVISDMQKSLGEAYDFLCRAHKAILSSAYIFFRTDFVMIGSELELDYSSLISPAYRALEGYILKQLVNNNILHDNNESIGFYFRGKDQSNPLVLHSQYATLINDDDITSEINRLYKLYHKMRHPYSHSAENDYKTSIITNRELADKHFKDIIEAISTSYKIIKGLKQKEKW